MSLDAAHIARAVAAHGPVARIVVADTRGSTPRETGTSMLVWPGGQDGTIGGGTLEHEATLSAVGQLTDGQMTRLERHALGPDMGQCCGGAVTLVTEIWDAARLADLPAEGVFARPVRGQQSAPPLAVARILGAARGEGRLPAPALIEGWMVEPLRRARTPVWIWGAGHVGRALVGVLAPLPDLEITWIDTGPERFPAEAPEGVRLLPVPDPANAVALAPAQAHHLVLTYSHTLDLALCNALLGHGFAGAGLIGSATKWARFSKRLKQMGHAPAAISRIICPIGQKSFGKHPQAIAVGVAGALLMVLAQQEADKAARGETGDGTLRHGASDA